MRVLILIDEITLPYLRNGEPPSAPFSHDKNLYQFAHEALRQGCVVFFAAIQKHPIARDYYQVSSVYPEWRFEGDPTDYGSVRPDIIVAVFTEALNIREYFPHPKIVAIHAALHWVESPERFSAQYLFDLITAVRYNVDFIITQNERMKSLIFTFYNFLAKWNSEERIIVAPLGIVPEERREEVSRADLRAQLGLSPSDIAIVNSGGVWRWTDVNTFMTAFCDVVNAGASNLKLFIMGLAQPTNTDHVDYINDTMEIIKNNAHLLGQNLFIEFDWDAASKVVKNVTRCADIGLNVNRDSLENWQSYRLRFLDYMTLGLPAINTSGDYLSANDARDAVFLVEYGNLESYRTVLRAVSKNPKEVEKRRRAMLKVAERFDSRNTYGKAIERIIAMERRDPQEHNRMEPCVLDYANERATRMMTDRLKHSVEKLFLDAVRD